MYDTAPVCGLQRLGDLLGDLETGLDAEGTVVHLLPSPQHPGNAVSAGEQVVIGTEKHLAGPGDRLYQIAPPYGTNMVVAISSRQPLFTQPRREVEQASEYFFALGNELRQPWANGVAAANYLFVDSIPAP